MTFEVAVQIATVISLLLTAGALLFGIWSFYRQMNCKLFLTYTERFEAIMGSFPPGALESRLRLGEQFPQRGEQLSLCILRYLNLCYEEFFLHQHGYLSKKIWLIWKEEIERMLRSPLLRREWQCLRSEFRSYPAFVAFVENVQASGPRQPPQPIQPPQPTQVAVVIMSETEVTTDGPGGSR
jgi:hypothetical protein